MEGRCLCGAVTFAVSSPTTSVEICHCERCRRAYGSAFAATFCVKADDFHWISGQDSVVVFDAPLREVFPPYRHAFCRTCGSPLPIVFESFAIVEIPAALMEINFDSRIAHQKWVSQKAQWWTLDPTISCYDEGFASLVVRNRMTNS